MQCDTTSQSDEPEEMILHDDTIQMLFAISLKVQYCLAVVDDTPQQAKIALKHILGDLDDVIAGLRERIDTLR